MKTVWGSLLDRKRPSMVTRASADCSPSMARSSVVMDPRSQLWMQASSMTHLEVSVDSNRRASEDLKKGIHLWMFRCFSSRMTRM